jgi:hypothetical protein
VTQRRRSGEGAPAASSSAVPEPRALACAPAVLVRLAQLRAASACVTGKRLPKPELDPSLIPDVEGALHLAFSDEILAILAARVPHIEDAYRMRLDRLPSLDEVAHEEGLPKTLAAMARSPHQGKLYFCLSRAPNAEPGCIIRYDIIDEQRSRIRLEEWLDLLKGEILRAHPAQLTRAQRRWIDNPLPLRPRLVARPRRSRGRAQERAPAPRHVSHRIFGVGVILREIGDGEERKLEIDFAIGGRKVLLERFVEPFSG